MARDINLIASCAHCGEVLDTNELTVQDILHGELDLSGVGLVVGTQHECFKKVCEECGESDSHAEECSEAPAEFTNYQE